jgi:hypothetical protein
MGEEGLVLDGTVWSPGGLIFRRKMLALAGENLSQFDFQYNTFTFTGENYAMTRWEFTLSREEVARIAQREVDRLNLYACANPICGYMSSDYQSPCPRCNLEAGAKMEGPHSQRVKGLCPYCNKPLRTLFAQQCRHCLMDWHNPALPTKLDAKP